MRETDNTDSGVDSDEDNGYENGDENGDENKAVAVVAPSIYAEACLGEGDDVQIFPAGQAYWIARTIPRFDVAAELCCAVGGRHGAMVVGAIELERVQFSGIRIEAQTPVRLRLEDAGDSPRLPADLEPGTAELWFTAALAAGLRCRTVVVCGNAEGATVPPEVLGRLVADLRNNGVLVIGDVHGPDLDAILAAGGLDVLKVSTDDLRVDGMLTDESTAGRCACVLELQARGAGDVVLSDAEKPTLARFGSAWLEAHNPTLTVVEHRGSGDSMTAALAVAAARRLSPLDTLRFACATGGANVTTSDLATSAAHLVEALMPEVRVVAHGAAVPA